MKQFDIYGMSCAACSARVEKAVKNVSGVSLCSVNLLTNSMSVDGDFSDFDIINAVVDAGYEAIPKNNKSVKNDDTNYKTKLIVKKIIISLVFLIILMYFSMGKMIFNLKLPNLIEKNPLSNALIQFILSSAILVINSNFFVNGFKSILKKTPNMDALVALGSGASFIYSIIELFKMTQAYIENNIPLAHSLLHELYFESAAMILVLITVGKMLEEYSKGKTTNAIKSLIDLKPRTAIILKEKKEIIVPVGKVKVNDIFILKPGSSIPADGVVVEGFSAVNESALTGESIPVDKTVNSNVFTGTINQSGHLKCRATKVGEDTSLSQIIKMVTDASSSKAPISKAADRISGFFVPVVILIGVITSIIWLLTGATLGYSLSRGISVLVISCPCSLGLATPVAIMAGSGIGAKNGILFKNAIALEQTGKIKTVALDKTGTITVGKPEVTDIIPLNNYNEVDLLKLAYSIEKKSEHPLAVAIVNKAEKDNLHYDEPEDFKAFPGNGVYGKFKENTLFGGSLKFIEEKVPITPNIKDISLSLSSQGKTPLFFSKNNELVGIIAVSDIIKPDSANAISILKNMGINVVMLTGDNEITASFVQKNVGVDKVIANLLPKDKEIVIKELKKSHKTAMVGDGINDAPALTTADVGISIGAGTDVAIDAADIVLMKNSLIDVATAIRLSKKTLKNIYENLFWAFIYNIIGIPLAAGVFIPVFGITLNPMFAAAAMSLSSFCVVINALRLNFFKVKEDKKSMEKVIKIDGMMCVHCESRVKSALESVDGVTEVIPDHKSKTATVKLSRDVSDDIIKKTVEEQGYTVL